MHREPDVGFDPGSPGSRPGPKAGAKPLRHPGIPPMFFFIPDCFPHPLSPVSYSFCFYSLFSSFFLYSFFFFSFLSFFLSSLFLLFQIQFVFGHSALSKMTRRKTSTQNKESETVLSPTELQNLIYNSMSESQSRSTIMQLLVALEKSIKDSRDFMTAEFRSNQAEMKNQLNEINPN